MEIDRFWGFVAQARQVATEPYEIAKRTSELLARRTPEEIIGAHQTLWTLMAASYRTDLWGAAHLINDGASDDGFEAFRGWLITQGRDVFNRAVADPDSLADHPAVIERDDDLECEDMLDVAGEAYRAVTGDDLPANSYTIRYPELDLDWDFDDTEQARQHLPRLSALLLE